MASMEAEKILRKVNKHRQRLSERLKESTDRQNDHRRQNLLGYAVKHEVANLEAMDLLLLNFRPEVNKNWIRFYPLDSEHELEQILAEGDWDSFDEAIDRTIQVKAKIKDILEVSAESLNQPRVKSFFTKMYETEQTQLNNLGRRLVEINQGY